MIPIIITFSLIGLSLFAAARASAATSPKPSGKVWSDLQIRSAQLCLEYVNKGGTDRETIGTLQKGMGMLVTGRPDRATETRVEDILGYDVYWLPSGKKPELLTAKKVKETAEKKKKVKVSAIKLKDKAKETFLRATKVKKAPEKKGPIEELLDSATRPEKKPQLKAPKKTTVKRALIKPAKAESVKKVAPKVTSRPPMIIKSTKPAEPLLPVVPEVADNVLAADSLDKYLRSGGLDRDKVKGYQLRMGGLAVDGVAGPLTLARASEILDRDIRWPANDAALDLYKYYKSGGRDKPKIKSYQSKMGELDIDGLVGPKTKARFRSLTGKVWS